MKNVRETLAGLVLVALTTGAGCAGAPAVQNAPQQAAGASARPSPLEQAVEAEREKEAEAAKQPIPLTGPQ